LAARFKPSFVAQKRCIALAGITIAEPFEHSPLTCGAIRRRGDFDKRLAENF
jgi:hypothetical protein